MEVDATLIIVVAGSVGALLIERGFYYRLKYTAKKKEVVIPSNPGNPGHGERLMGLETDSENLRNDNDKDHVLIRKSIDGLSGRIEKLTGRINGVLNK